MEIRKLGGGGMVGLSGGKTGKNSEVNMLKIHCKKFLKIIEKICEFKFRNFAIQ